MSDFPEFDQAYQTVLVKDLEDKFERLAAAANFNIYHSDIWRGTARKFAESIVQECVDQIKICAQQIRDDEGYREDNFWPIFANIVDDVAADVQEHFGITND